MNIRKRFTRFAPALVSFSLISLSSCNRGYGCPTNFSFEESVAGIVTSLIQLF